MATFRLKDWRRWSSRLRRVRPTLPARDPNTAVLAEWLLSTGLCIGLAAILPAPVTPLALAALLSLAGFIWLSVAIAQAGPPVDSPHLTA